MTGKKPAGENTVSVTKGTHSVTTQVYVTDAATPGDYDIQYQILTT
jgi:hypothetical protein